MNSGNVGNTGNELPNYSPNEVRVNISNNNNNYNNNYLIYFKIK